MNNRIMGFIVMFIFCSSIVIASDALIAYTTNNAGTNEFPEIVKVKFWNSSTSTFGSLVNLSNSGSPVLQVAAEYWNWSSDWGIFTSPNRFKALVASQSYDGYLDFYYCTARTAPECGTNSSRWGFQSNVGKVPGYAPPLTYERYFDLERESTTNDTLLVYAVNNSNSNCDLAYQVIPGTNFNFSGVTEQCLDDTGHSTDLQYSWVELTSKANSQEILLEAFDKTNKHINAWIWNGSSFGNQVEISSSASDVSKWEGLAVRYAADGSKGLALGAYGPTGSVNYRYWNGTTGVQLLPLTLILLIVMMSFG